MHSSWFFPNSFPIFLSHLSLLTVHTSSLYPNSFQKVLSHWYQMTIHANLFFSGLFSKNLSQLNFTIIRTKWFFLDFFITSQLHTDSLIANSNLKYIRFCSPMVIARKCLLDSFFINFIYFQLFFSLKAFQFYSNIKSHLFLHHTLSIFLIYLGAYIINSCLIMSILFSNTCNLTSSWILMNSLQAKTNLTYLYSFLKELRPVCTRKLPVLFVSWGRKSSQLSRTFN